LQGNFFKNKEILNGWKEIMFFENGSTGLNMRQSCAHFAVFQESESCETTAF
jgi:hypothetical protein